MRLTMCRYAEDLGALTLLAASERMPL
jgi:hypothetical protein